MLELSLAVSQLPPETEADTLIPLGDVVTLHDSLGGGAPPEVKAKTNGLGVQDTESVLGTLTVSVTCTTAKPLLAPGAVRVTVPLYVPAANPTGFTETEIEPGVLPLAPLNVSQLPPELVAVAAV
jgi:hypothetical protein